MVLLLAQMTKILSYAATLQGSNILMALNIDLVRGLFHHSLDLSHLLALCQGMLFFSFVKGYVWTFIQLSL